MTIAAIIALYIVGGVMSYGLMYAFWRENWPEIKDWPGMKRDDAVICLAFAALWPLALPIHVGSVVCSEKMWPFRYGIKFRG